MNERNEKKTLTIDNRCGMENGWPPSVGAIITGWPGEVKKKTSLSRAPQGSILGRTSKNNTKEKRPKNQPKLHRGSCTLHETRCPQTAASELVFIHYACLRALRIR